MAFVRWRGRCAQVLATVYTAGRSKQITLASLPGFYVQHSTKQYVAKEYPNIKVDWHAIDQALAKGPPELMKKDVPPEHLDMASVEHYLRRWARMARDIHEASRLESAADILTRWRESFYSANVQGR